MGRSRTRSSSYRRSTNPTEASLSPPPRKMKKQAPQDAVDEFWAKFSSKTPGQVSNVLPKNIYTKQARDKAPKGVVEGENAVASYEEAVEICKAKVEKIVRECRRLNQKYRDPHFDIEFDLKWGKNDCLDPLGEPSGFAPQSVKRVGDIFDKPQFYIDGPTANDIRQGRDAGDCWIMAALCTLGNKEGLIERVCVARDEVVGVYGFVFHRDGEFISEIVDDKLYLTKADWDEGFLERILFEDRTRVNSEEEEYRRIYQTNSGSLYFAQCKDPNETWLPLMEKAYAKAHGDYAAIEGGFTGEGLEDLTGGVTQELLATDILDKERFWKDELLRVNDEFLFGCATGIFRNWGTWGTRKGIQEGHAYSIMRAVEVDDQRLLLLKNPWGQGEWTGPWSDGSKEWTPYWMEKLGHQFGDDGAFWISYDDLLRKYQSFDRTRLFSPEWKVSQQWTSLEVAYAVDYHDIKFSFTLEKDASVVIVLSQLDDRYFRGLQGQYWFELSFRVHKIDEEDYIVRSRGNYRMNRSVSAELDLEAGEYHVRMKIKAERNTSAKTVEEVIQQICKSRRDKLMRIGLAYDLAHSKGKIVETTEEKEGKKAAEERKKEKARKEAKEKLFKEKKKRRHIAVKDKRRMRAAKAKREARATENADKRKAAEKQKEMGKETEAKTEDKKQEETTQKEGETATEPINDVAPDVSKKLASLNINPPPSTASGASIDNLKISINGIPAPYSNFGDDDDLSDTDTNVSDISDGEVDDELATKAALEVPLPLIPPPPVEDEEDEFEKDPWNAVAVVGLRVYSKGSNVAIKVVRPKTWLIEDEDEKEKQLDVDDSAADAMKGTDISSQATDIGVEKASEKKDDESEVKNEA